ncbi:RimK family alpha-L-glutamate ligase [Streptomyces sp. NPDC058657]|uniref:ATP-grasp domain-containing protein n=1 Tax=unclassified Streptomyces TaxID=2593676 RepID=UPI003667C80C
MRLCFLVEERYRNDGMPLEVIRQLTAWGHRVDILRPGGSLLPLTGTMAESVTGAVAGSPAGASAGRTPARPAGPLAAALRAGEYDAWILKTVSGGPGLTLLEAAAEAGATTVNDARAIRRVRDKALAASIAAQHGLPVPPTYAAAAPGLLAEIPESAYPMVVKPADGSAGRAVRLVTSPGELARLRPLLAGEGMLIAQSYVANSGTDLKVYSVGGRLYATERRSPLHPEHPVPERRVPLPAEIAALVERIGAVYGLDLYGVDVLLGPDGPVVVDVNDFPSFRQVPDAAARVARAVLGLARGGSAKVAPVRTLPLPPSPLIPSPTAQVAVVAGESA